MQSEGLAGVWLDDTKDYMLLSKYVLLANEYFLFTAPVHINIYCV